MPQINMWTLNLYHIICQLSCNKAGGGKINFLSLLWKLPILDLYFFGILAPNFLIFSKRNVILPYLSEKPKHFLFKMCVLTVFVSLHQRSILY